jgi:hypothetical protein
VQEKILCEYFTISLFPAANLNAVASEKDVNSGRRFGYLHFISH